MKNKKKKILIIIQKIFFFLYVNVIECVSESGMYMRNIPSISPTTFLSPECPPLTVPPCSLLPSPLR